MALTRTAAPAELITLIEAKAHLNISHADDDTLITSLIAAALDVLDGNTGEVGKALVTQTWEWKTSGVSDCVELPVKPVQSITSITYYDTDNVSQTATVSDYELDEGYLRPKTGKSWPATYPRFDAVTITFVAGYGDADDVPAGIKHAGLLLIGHYYENREDVGRGNPVSIPRGVSALVSRHKSGWVGG